MQTYEVFFCYAINLLDFEIMQELLSLRLQKMQFLTNF